MTGNETAVENTKRDFSGFTGNQLKLIAVSAMFLDHLAWNLWPGYQKEWWLILIHLIGRLTAPMMWFMIVEGYCHTRNLKKYLLRLFIFSILSHFAYNFCFGISFIPFKNSFLNQTSVMWALSWAVAALYIQDDERRGFKLKEWQKTISIILMCLISFPSDWSCFPVLCSLMLFRFRGNLKNQMLGMLACITMYVVVWCFAIDVVYGLLQYGIIIVWPFMHFYNGQRGKWKGMKWFFYLFYVGHLILLGILRLAVNGNIKTIV